MSVGTLLAAPDPAERVHHVLAVGKHAQRRSGALYRFTDRHEFCSLHRLYVTVEWEAEVSGWMSRKVYSVGRPQFACDRETRSVSVDPDRLVPGQRFG